MDVKSIDVQLAVQLVLNGLGDLGLNHLGGH
jgi:hypothetical protein